MKWYLQPGFFGCFQEEGTTMPQALLPMIPHEVTVHGVKTSVLGQKRRFEVSDTLNLNYFRHLIDRNPLFYFCLLSRIRGRAGVLGVWLGCDRGRFSGLWGS